MEYSNTNDFIKEISKAKIAIKVTNGGENKVKGLEYNSKKAGKNYIFFCKGKNFKNEYLRETLNKKPSVICFEKGFILPENVFQFNPQTEFWEVSDIDKAMAVCANKFYEYPANSLFTIGVTGTKGKTTVCEMLKNILNRRKNEKTTLLSDEARKMGIDLTTPESIDFQKIVYECKQRGVKYLICEISSQAMKKKRAYGVNFKIGLITNFAPDHISENEHKDLNEYLLCKISMLACSENVFIFDGMNEVNFINNLLSTLPRTEVLKENQKNKDIEFVSDLIVLPTVKRIFTYGFSDNSEFSIKQISGQIAEIKSKKGKICRIVSFLPMSINKCNILASYAIAKTIGFTDNMIFKGIIMTHPKGRYKSLISDDGKIKVIIDYAHNGLSLEALLKNSVECYPQSKIITIFGCTGDKAKNRRYDLIYNALKYSDKVYLTEDDSGKEGFNAISNEVKIIANKLFEEKNLEIKCQKSNFVVTPNRSFAINDAIFNSLNGENIVHLAGKGDDKINITSCGKIGMISDSETAYYAITKYNYTSPLDFSSHSKIHKQICVCMSRISEFCDNFVSDSKKLLENGSKIYLFCSENDENFLESKFKTSNIPAFFSKGMNIKSNNLKYVKIFVNEEPFKSCAEFFSENNCDLCVYLTCFRGKILNELYNNLKIEYEEFKVITSFAGYTVCDFLEKILENSNGKIIFASGFEQNVLLKSAYNFPIKKSITIAGNKYKKE